MENKSIQHTFSPYYLHKNINFSTQMHTTSLPLLKNPVHEKIDKLFQTDRAKIQQKLKKNYFPHNISYIIDKSQNDLPPEQISHSLDTNIKVIYKNHYNLDLHNFDIIEESPEKKVKTPKLHFIDKILAKSKTEFVKKSKIFNISAPTSRQEAINLRDWFEFMEKKYFSKLKDLITNRNITNRDELIKAWKAVYLTAMKELERQITVNCIERGQVMQLIIQGYDQLYDLIHSKFQSDLQKQSETYAKDISECHTLSAKNLAFFQVKIEKLEKEKNDLRYINGQQFIKIKELERYLEEFKRLEKNTIRNINRGNTLKSPRDKNMENIQVYDEKNENVTVSEKLVNDFQKKLEKIQKINSEIKEKRENLKNLELEISDKQCLLSTLNFEVELSQVATRPIAKYMPKVIINIGGVNKEKKIINYNIKEKKNDDELIAAHLFFSNLKKKSKDRLIQKARVPQDHIFQSLTVIYNRSILQINLTNEGFDFQLLVYKQFVKSENRVKNEKILKSFLGGCLKFSDFKRVSVFLRFLQIGELINKPNFLNHTFQVYLSLFFYMQNSNVGYLTYKESKNPIQFYPVLRAYSCISELTPLFPMKIKEKTEEMLEKSLIQDPKQINPAGLIELESFLEWVSEFHDVLYLEIIRNCENLYKSISPIATISLQSFKKLLICISPNSLSDFETQGHEILDSLNEISINVAIDICCRTYALKNEDFEKFIQENFEQPQETLRKITSEASLTRTEIWENILKNFESVDPKFVLTWWKVLAFEN